jgi:hypothetical protein
MIVLFGLALGWVELTFLAIFFLLMIVGTSFDRAGQEHPKWYILGVGFAAIGWYYWKDLSMSSLWMTLSTWAFWKPIVIYFVIGLIYSLLEFVLDVRRSARQYAEDWQKHLNSEVQVNVLNEDGKPKMQPKLDRRGQPVMAIERVNNALGTEHEVQVMENVTKIATFAEGYRVVAEAGAESARFNEVNKQTTEFLGSYRFKNRIIEVQIAADKIGVEPKINRLELAEHIGAWTFLWPAYAVSLIIGDLLTEVFRSIADFLAHISGRFVKMSFANVFKF